MTSGAPCGVIGLGAMGGAVAARLLAEGRDVLVHDVNPEAVARTVSLGASAPGLSAVASVPVLFTSLPNDEILDTVVDHSLLSRLTGGTLVELSTTLPQTVRTLADRAATHDVAVVDAPVGGGPDAVLAGQLVLYVGGPDHVLDAVRPLLGVLGRVEAVGAVGMGKAMKLVNNMMSIGNMAVAAEAFGLGERLGLDLARMVDVIEGSGGRSAIVSRRMPRVLANDFVATFSLGLAAKDIRIALRSARSAGFAMATAEGVREVLESGETAGLGGEDLGSLLKVTRPTTERRGTRPSAPGAEKEESERG